VVLPQLSISWCAGDRCDMASSKPGAEDQGWLRTCWVLGGRTIERSGDAVCGLHHAQGDEEHMFLV
jgi:hypothetical protein